MPALPSFLKNKRNLGLIFFGLFFVSVMTNIALLRQPDPVSVQNVRRLESQVASQSETIATLNGEIRNYRSQVGALSAEVEQLEEQEKGFENPEEDVRGVEPETEQTPATTPASTTRRPAENNRADIGVETEFALMGAGCNFAPSSVTGPQADKVCELVDRGTGTVLSTLIECGKQKYLTYPAGSEGICAQGAELIVGKRDALNVYLVNLATIEGAGQNLHPYRYSYRTGELEQVGTFFAAPRTDGFSENASTQDLGRQFAEAYKKYVADEIPADYFRRLYIYE